MASTDSTSSGGTSILATHNQLSRVQRQEEENRRQAVLASGASSAAMDVDKAQAPVCGLTRTFYKFILEIFVLVFVVPLI